MKKFASKSFLFGIITTVIALIIMDTYIWQETRTFILSNLKEELSKKVALVKHLINQKSLEDKDKEKLKAFADEIKNLTGYRTTLIDKQGDVLADSELPVSFLPQVENHLNRPEVQQAMRTGSGLNVRTSATLDIKLIYYCETLRSDGRVTGFIRFAVFSPEYKARTAYLRSIIIKINIILFILAVVAIYIYWRWFNRQVKKIVEPVVQQKDRQGFVHLPAHKYEEFDVLRAEVNVLGEKLEAQKTDLVKRHDQLANILHSLDAGVAAFDHRGFLLYYNHNFTRILQIQKEFTTDLPYYDWIHFPPIIQDIENYLSNRQAIRKRTKYYKNLFIEYQILPLQFNEETNIGFIVMIQDVTHLQQLETIRQDFVANVSHEFKTPLTSIRGYAETLLAGMDENPEVRRKFLTKIQNQTRRLENLVADLLQLSRIEKKEITELENIELVPVVEELVEEFTPITRTKNLKFIKEISEDAAGKYIEANKNLIHTLISNLMINAIQYNKSRGKIWLRVKSAGKSIRIEVEDTGVGIPPDQLNRVFERFYRVENARFIYPEGSGLGLSIIKHVVNLLNGQIEVESQLGKGTTFRVEIPLVV
jgi:two-component system phosphate regulon sensor histidine kinase PhoR